MKKVILLFLFIISFSFSKEITLTDRDFDKAILDICHSNQSYCKILTDKQINSYLRKYYKIVLYTIAHVESNFKYKQGKYDKDDISYFQINKRVWNRKELKKYNINYSYYEIQYDIRKASEVALRIWLINIAHYINTYHKYPKSLAEYIALYHKPTKISKNYVQKVRKVVYKYLSLP